MNIPNVISSQSTNQIRPSEIPDCKLFCINCTRPSSALSFRFFFCECREGLGPRLSCCLTSYREFHVSSQIMCSSSISVSRSVYAQFAWVTRLVRYTMDIHGYTAISETRAAGNLRVQYLNYRCESVFRQNKLSESAV